MKCDVSYGTGVHGNDAATSLMAIMLFIVAVGSFIAFVSCLWGRHGGYQGAAPIHASFKSEGGQMDTKLDAPHPCDELDEPPIDV